MLLALLLALTQGTDQPAARVQYKSAVLGMTLDEWKALPFPGAPRPDQTVFSMCTDNPRWMKLDDALPVSRIEQSLGVVECGYYTKDKFPAFTMRAVIPIGATTHTVFDVDYAFYQGRLFRIVGSSQLAGISDMVEGLTARYGKPQTMESSTQNRLGATFPKTDYLWTIGRDTILATAPSGRIDRSGVVYLDTLVNDQLKAAKERLDPAADKM